ncbi:MAG: HAMP domain-containing sensor histidine kinase [Bergeyella sp.]
MPNRSGYKAYSLRNKIFWGFLLICILSILGSGVLSFYILRNNAMEQSRTQMLKKSDAMMSALDYEVSHSYVQTENLPEVLENSIFEISDVNKQDIILYDLAGKYLISNKDYNLVALKKVPLEVVNEILKPETRIDRLSYDKKTRSTVTSSFIMLKNNMLEPIAIVYFPYYHNDSAYLDVFNKYVKYIILIDLFIILLGGWLSWIISKNLTNMLTRFSERINSVNFFDKDPRPIRYYKNDELGSLVKAYNKMILQIQEQKERLSHTEREHAWREMAKQVAHEVKNPLTPMKLSIQNFVRRFDKNDPDIEEKVKTMGSTMIDQIDLIAAVASAFSQFAQLPEKNNEVFSLNQEIAGIVQIFSGDRIFVHSNMENIMVEMDKIYLNRIITNLVTNARQAEVPGRKVLINIDIEKINKKIFITVEDNGSGIPPEIKDRIFEPNFTSKSSGMGLGLTMVKKMVEDYKGEITVKSEVGMGTKFIISFPANT